MSTTITRVSTTSTGQQADGASTLQGDEVYGPEGGAVTGVFSPDGTKILFTTGAENITGSQSQAAVIKNLATGRDTIESGSITQVSGATFSPDGTAVVFDGAPSGGGQRVYETNVATGQTTLVGGSASGSTSSYHETVSTDGSKVVIENSSASGVYSQTTSVANVGTGQQVLVGDGNTSVIASTPSLNQVLYVEDSETPTGYSQIHAENVGTGASSLVSSDAAGNAGNQGAYDAYIKPDGTQAVFDSDSTNLSPGAAAGGIFTKTLSTGAVGVVVANQQTVTGANSTSGLENDLVGLSTDGTKIAYLSDTYTTSTANDGTVSGTDSDQLNIKDLSTGRLSTAPVTVSDTYSYNNSSPSASQQTNNGTSFGQTVFSPDGTKIAYVQDTDSNEAYNSSTNTQSGTSASQVFVYDAGTGQATAISSQFASNSTGPSTYISDLQFSPDSKSLAYSTFTTTGSTSSSYTQQNTVVNLATGTQTVLPGDGGPVAFSPDGSSVAFASASSTLVAGDTNGASDVFIAPLCFCDGTLIRTARGDVPVEALAVGDLAVTASGAGRPIVWIGHRPIDCAALPVPSESWPVRVRAGAFGAGPCGGERPERELRLSPGHPVLVDDGAEGVLVPVMCLINGTSVARVPVDRITYWHVELDAHDILLAEGLPAESYLDLGSRAWFDAADGAGRRLDDRLTSPDLVAPDGRGRCRAVALDGPVVERERRRLDALFAAGLAGPCAWPGAEEVPLAG